MKSLIQVGINTGNLASQLKAKAARYRKAEQDLRAFMDGVRDIYAATVEQIVYIMSPEPKVYQRSMNLLRSIRMVPIQDGQGNRGIRIDFDPNISPTRDYPGESYSIYVVQPQRADTGFLKYNRYWTTDWRETAYNNIIEGILPILREMAGA